MNIDGKVVLATVAHQGIGRAITPRLAGDGADIVVGDVKEERIKAAADEVRKVAEKRRRSGPT